MKKFGCLFLLLIILLMPVLFRFLRPARKPVTEMVAPGISYQRLIFDSPSIVAHVVEIDLNQTAVRFQVTPTNESGSFTPLKTSSFLNQINAQIAINGGFYQESRQNGMLQPLGLVVSDGQVQNNGRDRYPTLCILQNQQIEISNNSNCPAETDQAIAGNVLVVENGNSLNSHATFYPGRGNAFQPQPRTAVAINEAKDKLWLVVVDGRQGGYSVGMTMNELATFLVNLGAHTAINLDGGGSSTLVTQSWYGANVRNSPIHFGIPTRQRSIPTHLGVIIQDLQFLPNME